jgi:PQQ-like domain
MLISQLSPRWRRVVLAALLVVAACAPRRAPHDLAPPPPGPFRTVAGAPTHPACTRPVRVGDAGAAPRCVASFGRNPTALALDSRGTIAVLALMDVQLTTWQLPALTFGRELAAPPAEPGEAQQGEREGPQAIAIAPDGRTALLAIGDEMLRYDLATGRVLGEVEGPQQKGMIDDVVFTPDGRSLVITNAADGKARLLDATTGAVRRTLPVEGHVVEVAVAADGVRAAAGTEVGTIAIVDLQSNAKPKTLTPSTQEITGLAFVGGDLVAAARDGHVRVFDAATGKRTQDTALPAPIVRMAVAPTGRLVAVADDAHALRVLSLPDATLRRTLAWHRATVTALAWASASTLIVADNDGELAAWDVKIE